jgi:Anti-sigma-K factor rskA, C-terminal
MSRLEALPADQKSVLQLLLRQGKGYDDLSGLLKLDVDEVRSRAYDALDTLGPGPGGLPAERRHEISDWLLGQQDPESATATRAFLDGSTAGRAWAHGVARELEPLAGDRLPELPAEAEPAAAADAAETGPVAEGADDEAAATPFAPAPSGAPRVSRRGGALLIGGVLAAIAVAVVLVIVLSGGDDTKSNTTASQAADTTSTQAQPQVRAQINLTPPKNGPVKKAVAIVQIIDVNGQQAITAATQGLKTPPSKSAYALWVYNSPTEAKLVSGFDKTDNKGHLVLQGQLPKDIDIAAYKEMLVTRETSGNPTRPGTIYLRGAIQNAAGG